MQPRCLIRPSPRDRARVSPGSCLAATLSRGVVGLLGTRIVGAFVYAGFWAVAAVTAVGLGLQNTSIIAGGSSWPRSRRLGAFGFATNPALNARVFSLAENAPTLATATNFSAFNVGITVGPWLGGLAIGAGSAPPLRCPQDTRTQFTGPLGSRWLAPVPVTTGA